MVCGNRQRNESHRIQICTLRSGLQRQSGWYVQPQYRILQLIYKLTSGHGLMVTGTTQKTIFYLVFGHCWRVPTPKMNGLCYMHFRHEQKTNKNVWRSLPLGGRYRALTPWTHGSPGPDQVKSVPIFERRGHLYRLQICREASGSVMYQTHTIPFER